MINRQLILLLGATLPFTQTPCRAQAGPTAASIREADHKSTQGLWVEAIEQYQRILETAGDDLVPVDPPVGGLSQLAGGSVFSFPWSSNHFLPARWVCHGHLSRFPAAALKLYRDRIDAAAATRLAQARKQTDDESLERLLADWFCSHAGEEAILLLAQRAFDRADFDKAERYWRILLPKDAFSASVLSYPVPEIAPADIQARLILVQLFRGQRDRARIEIEALRKAHPMATGLLAGRDSNYVETLEGLLKAPRQVTLPAPYATGKEWATFGADPSRNSNVTAAIPSYWPGPPTWHTVIPADPKMRFKFDETPVDPLQPRSLAFHPVIARGHAFLADAVRVHAFDLRSGSHTTLFDLRLSVRLTSVDLRLPSGSEVRHTLTYADGFLFARLGVKPLRLSANDDISTLENFSTLVCLNADAAGKDEPAQPVWTLRPPGVKDSTAMFEGAPLVDGDRFYVIVWRQEGGDAVTSVACYRRLGGKQPELLWLRSAGKPAFSLTASVRGQHDLLTLAGPNVVHCNHAGNIVALDARSGKPAWEFRYTRNERRPPPTGRDLCPCLYDGGRVFAAPADGDRLYCLDAVSGQPLWDIEGVDVVHLLGVTHGRLIATFAGAVKGIRAINVMTGAQMLPDGWTQHAGGGITTVGRGLVTSEMIYWPTKQGLQFLDPEDGGRGRQPVPGLFGNFAYADGVFVVATATELLGFVSEGKLVEPRRQESERQPADRLLLHKSGRSEVDRGSVTVVGE